MYVKGNNTTEILGHLEVHSKSLPSCFLSAGDLNWFKKGEKWRPYLQNGLSNKIMITELNCVLLCFLQSLIFNVIIT